MKSNPNSTAVNININNQLKKGMKKTVKAVIDGTVKDIIIGHSPYNMERPKDKSDLLSAIDRKNQLKVIFHLCVPQPFWNEGITLVDSDGEVIPPNTPNVYVPCDTADTYYRFETDEVLEEVEVHNFTTVQEYGKAIGTTMLFSRKLNNVEALGIASIASKNPTYKEIHVLARTREIPMNTAMAFFGVRLKQTHTTKLALGIAVEEVPNLKRTPEQANSLLDAVEVVFGKKEMGKRYAINAINATITKYDYETVLTALELIPASTISLYKMSECHEKESCLVAELVSFIEELRKRKAA